MVASGGLAGARAARRAYGCPASRARGQPSPRSGHRQGWALSATPRDDGAAGPGPSSAASRTPLATATAPASLLERAFAAPPRLGPYLGALAAAGAVSGTLLDGIHSRVALQVYDTAPIVLGGLHTSAAVPPLLAAFYVVLGLLHPMADNLLPSPETDVVRDRCNAPFVALAFGVLAAMLWLSATLYDNDVPYAYIHAALGAAAAANWRTFDGTRQGLALALLCAVGAPAAELVLLHFVPLWHYPRGDILDGRFVSWVFWCYFFYTPALGALSRLLWRKIRQSAQ